MVSKIPSPLGKWWFWALLFGVIFVIIGVLRPGLTFSVFSSWVPLRERVILTVVVILMIGIVSFFASAALEELRTSRYHMLLRLLVAFIIFVVGVGVALVLYLILVCFVLGGVLGGCHT